jgi:hypothetical protein
MKTEPGNDLEIQRLELERGRFKLEQQGAIFRSVAILGGIATFAWTSFSYFDTASRERKKQTDENQRAAAIQKVAGMQPFLTRQLSLFTEATQTTALLATSPESPDRAKILGRFWQLYWGELALVEHGKVEVAMVAFGAALRANAEEDQLQKLALKVAYACRNELAESWAEPSWRHGE